MQTPKQAQFQVSLKVLLRNGDKVLLTRDPKGYIDLPGGRIDVGEEDTSFEDVVTREVREELGEDVQFHLGRILFMYRVYDPKGTKWILAIVHDAEYISGDIALSKEHSSYEWIDQKLYKAPKEDFRSEHEEKYEAFKEYLDSVNNEKDN